MSYNIQNITLIILILILIIVIIYYLKNSSTKHNELIEKYTTPSNTDANVDDSANSIYGSHNSIATSQLHNFPTSETVVTLRPCQVQFNNTFDASGTGTHTYVYEDGWQEIATLKETSTSTANRIENKVISANNETNKDDKNGNRDVYTNYSEQSKCFKKISGSDNKYRYNNNDLIKYHTDKYVNLVELKDGATGAPEQYMQMEFDLESSNSSQHYNNLKTSICSLKYANTVSGLSGNLIRLTLNANNIITDIKRVTVDATNNHIFNLDPTFNISSLITSATSGKYKYNQGSQSYEYVSTNSASSGVTININLYKFDRNLLCDNTSGTTTYQNIKTYTKLDNAKININSIVNINLPPASTISNTTLPTRYNTDATITGDNLERATLITNIDALIDSELVSVNSVANSQISVLNGEKTTLINTRDAFINSIPSLQAFIDNAIIKSNYDNVAGLKYNALLNSANYNLKLKKVEYASLNLGEEDATINLSAGEEPNIKEVLTSAETDVYETRIFNTNDTFVLYDSTICEILVVGGGGGGGGGIGGGGGAGAVAHLPYESSNKLPAGTYTINVGNGGAGRHRSNASDNGSPSSIVNSNNTIIIIAEGGGGTTGGHDQGDGSVGGSGGGAAGPNQNNKNTGGAVGTSSSLGGFVGTINGNKGGSNTAFRTSNVTNAAGGGGAGTAAADIDPSSGTPGNGGDGISFNITGRDIFYGGGGGGGGHPTFGIGGKGGGGNGTSYTNYGNGGNGLANTGGGGGGGAWSETVGGNGGSGVVIIRYKTGIKQSAFSKKISLKYNSIIKTQEYNTNSTLTLNPSATADILIVGGGAGGARNDGAEGGGGGGGGGVIYSKLKISETSSRVLNIKIGGGGAPNNPGQESSIAYNNNAGNKIELIAKGGGTGGGSYSDCGWKGGTGKEGGSGGGGSGYCGDFDGGESTGVKNKSEIQNNDSSIVSYSYYGNKGGFGHNQAGGAGGGGAGEVGHSTTHRYDRPGRQGGSGINIPLFDDKYYGAGGGGGGQYQGGGGGNGGRGGGGNGAARDNNASNGLPNTGSGGGGTGMATPGSGGSGIVIIKYDNNDPKFYKLRVPTRTNVVFKTDNTTHYTGNLHGTYKITMNSTNIKIEVYPGVSGTKINIDDITINSNKMDIIYNLNKSTDDINKTDIAATSTVIDIYNTAMSYTPTHYYRYKISSHISKTYKNTTSGVDSVNFNMYLYSNTDMLIPSANYSIRYHYPNTDAKNVIIPIHIFITIKPMPSNPTYTGLKIKTYSRSANGLDETEIYAFIGKNNGEDTSIADFNSILNLTTSLTEKDVWGIVAKQSEINTQNAKLINRDNIDAIICDISQTTDRVCNIKTLISIKNAINNASFTTNSMSMIKDVSITSATLFPKSVANPVLNYNITDYISYESSTQKAPANRITTFNIKDSASKYVYFAIPQA